MLLVALAIGCGGDAGLSGPPPPGGGGLRPGLALTVRASGQGATVAQTLGWSDGVPGAEVRVHRFGTDFAWQTATTDGQGVARLPTLVSGRYRVAVYRPLSQPEAAQTGVNALAGGRILNVSADGSEHTLDVIVNQPGSLVISEVYAPAPFVAETNYDYHMYFEVYNNSEQTVFLDGLTFGSLLGLPSIANPSFSCLESKPMRKDPSGVWAQFLHRFPGNGGEYPLAPGTVATVALDAVDHSVVDSRFPDLSNADFELLGSGDVDNPGVPNMVEIGKPWLTGHGLRFYVSHTLFVAERLEPVTLARQTLTWGGSGDLEYMRVPAEALIDVVWTEDDDAREEQLYENCDGVVHESFDQLGGGFQKNGADLTFSVQRILLPGAPGRLQDTNVSAIDMVKAPYSPGMVP